MPSIEHSAAWADTAIDLGGDAPARARVFGQKQGGAGQPLVLHLHGGAFVAGDLDSGTLVATLLARSGARVVSLEYPLAPQHPFPAALETSHAALCWMQGHRQQLAGAQAPLYVAGEEAGGNLAAALSLMSRDRAEPTLAGQVLIAPMLDPCVATRSMREADRGPRDCVWAAGWRSYLARPADAMHPYACPALGSRLASLPPTLLVNSPDDPTRDETHAFARRLRDAKVRVHEAVVASARGWPLALMQPVQLAAAWADELREQLQAFFCIVRATGRPGDAAFA